MDCHLVKTDSGYEIENFPHPHDDTKITDEEFKLLQIAFIKYLIIMHVSRATKNVILNYLKNNTIKCNSAPASNISDLTITKSNNDTIINFRMNRFDINELANINANEGTWELFAISNTEWPKDLQRPTQDELQSLNKEMILCTAVYDTIIRGRREILQYLEKYIASKKN